ncbi:MAG: extracellular solute-binding protein, partial [Candidatus Izemoplasmatales bacterium]|nr:extracellular solute-binding protein [Candidatus Izemoplasmatales bacterium]
MKRFTLLLMIITTIFFGGVFRISALSQYQIYDKSNDLDDTFDISDFRNSTYQRKLNEWLEIYDYVDMDEKTYALDKFINLNPDIDIVQSEDYDNNYQVLLENSDKLVVEITVDETGLYEIGFDFLMPEVFYTIPTIEVSINDEILYNELNEVEMDVLWEVLPLAEEERYNRYGNELLPKAESISNKMEKFYLSDYLSLTNGNYQFLLEEGVNKIQLKALNLSLVIGQIYLQGKNSLKTYDEYQEEVKDALSNEVDEALVIQGENFKYKNDLEIKSSYYKESAMTPYSYKNTVLNQLDGPSMSRGGSKVVYEFEVFESGYYRIAFKKLQNQNLGLAVGKNIYLDGVIPFEELSGYLFSSSRSWENTTLGKDDEDFWFYLDEGKHTLSLESTVVPYAEFIDELNMIMDNISSISLMVKTITGGNNSDTVDWDILKYIPDLVERLNIYADRLEEIYDEIDEMDTGVSGAGETSTLNVAAKQLRRIAKNPNKIGSKLQEFSEGSGSAYQLIGNAISYMMQQPLSIDCIYVYQDQDLPKATGSFFRKLWDGIKGFFYSFFDTRYNDNDVDEDTLEVWVGQSTLYLDIIQSMIDQDFTKDTGIKVKASIMNNVQKIVLSNATDDNPDAVLAIDNWNPYAYALRGILADLTEFDDFEEVSENYYANNFTPLIFEDGVYGIPETQSVFLLYYRKDILDYLDLDVPDTWEDIINMLPILQSHQMNFYHPLGGESSFKGYGFTSPIIYQFGGEIYSEFGIESTLRDENTIKAIKFMTDLFTIYKLPLQVSSFF